MPSFGGNSLKLYLSTPKSVTVAIWK